MDIKAPSASEALRICTNLQRTGKATLFRGQKRDWPTLAPSLLRLSSEDRNRSAIKLKRFLEWANAVPQMASYRERLEELTAIAQHYGIPTTFLDLTGSPEIALLFAKREHQAIEAPDAVVYCFAESELRLLLNAQILRLDVANLWRLEAQEGLFLDFLDDGLASQLRNMATRVHFPSELLTEEERARLYPVRKSALENVLDQWFYRHEVENLMEDFETKILVRLKRHSYPGAFVRRQIPDVSPEWLGELERWFLSDIETMSILRSRKVVTVPVLNSADIRLAIVCAREAIEVLIRASLESAELLSFEIQGKRSTELPLLVGAAQLLNRVWDGIRKMPYSADELVACMSLCSALVSLRAHGVKDIDDWEKQLWGNSELLEVAPIGGHIEAGGVSQAQLAEAYSTKHWKFLAKPFRRMALDNPRELMSYVVEPFILFDFEPFKRIFVEQFIPSAVDSYWKEDINLYDGQLKSLWSIPFNPALLGYVTNVDFRFSSPLALEEDPTRIVYILADMTQEEIEETFVYCLAEILQGGEPYQVRFQGYAFDKREIWEIEQAVQQCKDIVSVSGISVLEVSTFFLDPSGGRKPLDSPGLGAFEVWMIARGLMSEVQGKPVEWLQPLFSEFREILMHANADLESRAIRWQQKDAQN